jgi:hypothetical protein
MDKILSIIASLLALFAAFFNKKTAKKEAKRDEAQKVLDKQTEVNFQSKVEDIVKKAESKNDKEKSDALRDVRVLLAE